MSNFGMKPSPNGVYVEDNGEEYILTNRTVITESITDKVGYSLYKALGGNNKSRICMSYPDENSTVVLLISDVIIEYYGEAGLGLPFLGDIITLTDYLENHITVGMSKNVVSWLNINLYKFIRDDLIYFDEARQGYVWFNVGLSQETKAVVWGDLEKKSDRLWKYKRFHAKSTAKCYRNWNV